MRKREMKSRSRRLLAVALAAIIGVAFMPMLGGTVQAAQTDDVTVVSIDEALGLNDVGLTDPELLNPEIDALSGSTGACGGTPPADATIPDEIGEIDPDSIGAAESAAQNRGAASDTSGGITLTPDNSTGKLTVEGTVSKDTFQTLGVIDSAGKLVASGAISGTSFSQVLDMSVLPVGAYIIAAQTKGGKIYSDAAMALVYDKPANKKKQYEVYSKYLNYKANNTHYRDDYNCGLYMEIKKKGAKKWTAYGPLDSVSTIKKLKPNKTYQARTFYGKIVTINGENFFLSGKINKKYTTVTFKTGKKKLPIKSVSVKAVNVKKYTHKRYGYTGLYLGKETWYTYRLQVTVTMKKKPGIKALYINGKRVKGNKKTYRVKFAKVSSIMYGKHKVKRYGKKWWKQDDYYLVPRGVKYTVAVYSYRDKAYKGYSNIQKRKTRVK